MFVDFSGDGLEIVDPVTGEISIAKLFAAVLGASNLTYAEPVLSEDLSTWAGCHVRAVDYFGGCSEIWVPDNLKSGVKAPNRCDLDLNATYAELARHYSAAVIRRECRSRGIRRRSSRGCFWPSGGSWPRFGIGPSSRWRRCAAR
jgi:transposase